MLKTWPCYCHSTAAIGFMISAVSAAESIDDVNCIKACLSLVPVLKWQCLVYLTPFLARGVTFLNIIEKLQLKRLSQGHRPPLSSLSIYANAWTKAPSNAVLGQRPGFFPKLFIVQILK